MAASQSPAKTSLDDDWEEVGDDYSVVSLPTSDDEHEHGESPFASPRAEPSSKGKSSPTRLNDQETTLHNDSSTFSDTKPLLPASSPPSYAAPSKRRPRYVPGCRGPYRAPDLSLHTASSSSRDTRDVPVASDTTKKVVLSSEALKALEKSTATRKDSSPRPSAAPQQGLSVLDLLGTPLRREQPPAPERSAPDLATQTSGRLPSEKTGDMEQTVSEFNNLSVRSRIEEAEASIKRGGTLGESLDLDESSTDPIFIHTALQSLGQAILKLSQLAAVPRQNQREATEIHSICQVLMAQVNELRPILAEYADHWTKLNVVQRDIPLDPSLLLWMSSLSGVLSEVQKKIGLLGVHPGTTWDMELLISFTDLYRGLSDHSQQMDDFLPIMRIDFNDWRTKNMSFPSPTTPETSAGPRHNFQSPFRSVDQLPRVRHTMYALKDEIHRAIEVLDDCQSWLPHPASNTAIDVLCSLGSVFEAVSLALTNNGSEWIENDLGVAQNGLLSHVEFSNLDPSTIEDFTARIKQISDLVHIDPDESRLWSIHMIREHHVCMLIEQQQLDALETIASVLKEIMMPNHVKTKIEFEEFLKEI